MKAASLSHQYLAVKSSKRDSLFGTSRSRDSQRNQIRSFDNDQNRLVTPATEPLSRRTTVVDESTTPSVAVITRSLSDSNTPYVVYESKPASPGK